MLGGVGVWGVHVCVCAHAHVHVSVCVGGWACKGQLLPVGGALGLGSLGRTRKEVLRQAAALGIGTAGLGTPERSGGDRRSPWSWGPWGHLAPP